jgi:cysteine desulfurase family protein (TIGR01976 family)
VIEAISNYYKTSNSNSHGAFITTRETDEVISYARESTAALMGASGPENISFGQNMTTLNFSLSKALARFLDREGEILITQLDHEANRGPWLAMRAHGFKVKEVRLTPEGALDYQDFQQKLTGRTSLVAVGYASNALGTVNDLKRIRQWTHDTGSLLLVDAVHYAPHFGVDVTDLDCDFMLCSAYKFYGPHVGILYCRPGLLNQLPTDRLVTQEAMAPHRIETGTLNHAALAGLGAAINYLASHGEGVSLREKLLASMSKIAGHEFILYKKLHDELSGLRGLTIIGPPPDPYWHTPTISFTLEGHTPADVCKFLASVGICAWDGHFYAQRAIEMLGLAVEGGVTRMGINMYNSQEDVEYTVKCMDQFLANNKSQITNPN